jgi:DNA-directed RNA polymerase specialized sigma subunit
MNLENQPDESLIKNIKGQKYIEKSLKILINRHSGICIDMINAFLSKKTHKSIVNDLIKDKDYLIYSAALQYDKNKGSKFSTFLANTIKWKCLNIHNRDKRRSSVPVEDEKIEYLSYSNKNSSQTHYIDIYSHIIKESQSHPDKRIQKIFYLRYEKGNKNSVMPWRLISGELNMSIQGCINLHNQALNQFKKKIIKEI